MKIIKIIMMTLYCLIDFTIIIYGITGLSNILNNINITGLLNTILTFLLVVYGIGMFAYDVNKVYSKKEE